MKSFKRRRMAGFLRLGSISGVVNQPRPPVQSDFGGGGLQSPIYVNALTGECFIYVNGTITPINTLNVVGSGAKGDGINDDFPAIQAALNAAPFGSTVLLPAGSYRVSQGITIPAGIILAGLGIGRNISKGGPQIIADLAVATVVTINGGNGSAACGIFRIAINRAAGAIPASSVGLLIQSSDSSVIEDVMVFRCDIAFKTMGQLGIHFFRCQSTQITSTHLWIENTKEVKVIDCRFGQNGGFDVSCSEYVRIKGNSDTIHFTNCQFNLSAGLAARAVFFDTYASPNGIIDFVQCHFELFTAMVQQTGTTQVLRLGYHGCTVNGGGAGQQAFVVPAAFFTELVIEGCPFWLAAITLDQCGSYRVVGSKFHGDVLLNQGSGAFIGNDLLGNLTVQGICVGLTVLGNNKLTGGKTFANTATGQISCDIENTSFVPVITSAAGAFTTVSATFRYTLIGSRFSYFIEITDTTNGTAGTNIRYTLPYTPVSNACASGVETTTGKAVSATWQSGISKMVTVFYDNTYPGASGNVVQLNGSFTIAL